MCHLRINPTLPKSRESKRTHTQNQQSGTRSSDALTYRIRFRCTHSPLPISVRRQVSNPRCVITSAFHTETRRNLSVTSLHGTKSSDSLTHVIPARFLRARAEVTAEHSETFHSPFLREHVTTSPRATVTLLHSELTATSTEERRPAGTRRGRCASDAESRRKGQTGGGGEEEAGEVRADGAELRTSTRSTRCALVPPPQASAEGSLPPTHTPTFVT